MTLLKKLVLSSASVSLLCSSAIAEDLQWGLVRNTYTVGASKLVTKDQGELAVSLWTSCADRADEVQDRISELSELVKNEVSESSDLVFDESTQEITIDSQARYQIAYANEDVNRLNPYFIDSCTGEKIQVGNSNVDLTKLSFTGYLVLKIVATENLSRLTTLRQSLSLFAEKQNKESAANKRNTQITVNQESIVVSEQKRADTVAALNDDARLNNTSKQSRLFVDKGISGGFSEMYITEVNSQVDGYPSYKNYAPQLTEEGRSKVEVPYTFSVQYVPANLIESSDAKLKQKGTLVQTYVGEAVVDTDYYVAQIEVSTSCHDSEKAATAATVEPFDLFKKHAKNALTSTDSPYERVEETIGTAGEDGQKWIPWTRELKQAPHGQQIVITSYLNTCNASVKEKVEKSDKVYAVTHRLTLVTNNYNAIKELQKEATLFTQEQRKTMGAKRVEVVVQSITPNLKDDVHYEAVEVLAYVSALKQMTSASGEMANKLLDEVQAGEAYYTVGIGYSQTGDMPVPRAASMMESAADSGGASSYKVVVAGDDNIPMSEIRVDNTYSVVYRPQKDLIAILKEARESLEKPSEMPIH